jgi:hypothetical protein
MGHPDAAFSAADAGHLGGAVGGVGVEVLDEYEI